MSDAPRRSPWLPVNEAAPAASGPVTGETALPVRPTADAGPQGNGAEAPPNTTAYVAVPTAPNPAEAWAPMRPAGIDPSVVATASASPVTLTKPAQPIVAAPARVPRPIEAEDPEVIRPVAAPPASEILPTTGGVPLVPLAFSPEGVGVPTFEPADEAIDPFRLLGESAVAAASLDAAGARTPAFGIPMPASDALPSFGLEQEFVPRFEPDEPGTPDALGAVPAPGTEPSPSSGLASPELPRTPVRTPLTGEQPRVSFTAASGLAVASAMDTLVPLPQPPAASSVWSEVASELPPHGGNTGAEIAPVTPGTGIATFTPAGPGALTIASVPPGVPSDPLDVEEKPRRRLLWLWIALAALGVAALGVLVYRLFLLPEPIILPAPVVTEAPPTPTVEPVEVTDPSEFLAGMPTEIGTFVLTSYEVVEVIGDETLPARAAEHLVLTYGESAGDDHFTVDAYQFYNTDDAATAFESWSEGAATTDDVTVDGTVVGERALVASDGVTSVVWRNGTSVFVLEGPADEVEQFYAYFGL
jgi:hypothetical protein